MGAGQSKPPSETVIHNESAIHFSQDLVNQLSDQLANPNVTPERQATLDAQILSRIASEVAKLREQEEDVLQQIGNALEKENIDREQALAGADSASLRHDLDTIQERVKSFQGRQRIPKQFPEVNSAREALVACYKSNVNTELNCAEQVADFKAAVAKLEQGFVESLKST